jgi:transposase-like protein
MSRRARRKFTEEFKARAVELVRTSGKSAGQIAKDLDLTETALREWLKKAETDDPRKAPLDEDERAKLKRLENEVRVLRMERDFLVKAAAFFARETK